MGFSVSGSAVIIFLAAFIGIGIFYSAAYNSYELVGDAQEDRTEHMLDQQNTDIAFVSVDTDSTNDFVNLTVDNQGATTLHVNRTDVLIDGSYEEPRQSSVDQNLEKDLWQPGQTLRLNISYPVTNGDTIRVKLITEHGVSVFQEVTA